MKKLKLLVALLLIFSLIFSISGAMVFAKGSPDIKGHWAEQTITDWLAADIVKVDLDGKFKPSQAVTRAEFVEIVNQALKLEKKSEVLLPYTDVQPTHWAYEHVKIAHSQGYIKGLSATQFAPDKVITRQEAAVIVTNVLKLTGSKAVTFNDANKVSLWAKDAVNGLVSKGILNGDKQGFVNPLKPLTRAEAVVLLSNAIAKAEKVFSIAGIYGSEEKQTLIEGHVRITSSNVTLVNTKITGNLIIDKGVGEGDVTLTKVEVLGDMLVQGGGENSIHLNDSVLISIIANKETGVVRIIASGATTVQEVIVQSSVKLEESSLLSSGFNNVELASQLPEGSNVSLIGDFQSVNILASHTQVTIPSGTINQLSVSSQSSNATVSLSVDAIITTLLLHTAAQFVGQGTIQTAVIHQTAGASSFAKMPTTVQGNSANIVIIPPTGSPSSGGAPSTPTGPQSNDATLHSITVTGIGNDDVEWKKVYLDKTSSLPLKGFQSEYTQYFTQIPGSQQIYNVEMAFEVDANARISVQLNENGFIQDNYPITNNKVSLTLDKNRETTVFIAVSTQDYSIHNGYSFAFIPDVNIQTMFRFEPDEDRDYIFTTDTFLNGDKVELVIPPQYTHSNEEFSITSTINNSSYHSGTVHPMTIYFNRYRSSIDMSKIADSGAGSFNVTITRDGNEIATGPFTFDFAPMELEDLPIDDYEIEYLNAEELAKKNTVNSISRYPYAYKLKLNNSIFSSLGNVKYVFIHQEDDFSKINKQYVTVRELHKHYFKTLVQTRFSIKEDGPYYDPRDYPDEYILYSENINLILTFFDEDLNFVKVVQITEDIPSSALAENVKLASESTPKGPLSDDATLSNITVSGLGNDAIVWKKLRLDKTSILPLEGFEKDYNNYFTTIPYSSESSESSESYQVEVELTLDENAQKKVDVFENGYPIDSIFENNKLNFTMKKNKAYLLEINITSENKANKIRYRFILLPAPNIETTFNFDYKQLSPDDFILSSNTLLTGDSVEVIIPKEYTVNNTEDYKIEYTVPSSNYEEGVLAWGGTIYFEEYEEIDQTKIKAAGTGSFTITLTRNGQSTTGEYLFDLTPIDAEVLDSSKYNLTFDLGTDFEDLNNRDYPEIKLYSYVFKLNESYTSSIENAKYVNFMTSEISYPFTNQFVREVENVNSRVDLGYYVTNGFRVEKFHYQETPEVVLPSPYVQVYFVFYDENFGVVELARIEELIPATALPNNVKLPQGN